MLSKIKSIHVFYFIVVSYILTNAYVLAYNRPNFYAYNLIPLLLLIAILAIFDIEKIMYIMVFSTPLAITLQELGLTDNLNLSLPSEPLMIAISAIYLLNGISHHITDKKILKHPITIIIILQIIWMFVSTLFSELPLVSIKYFISRLWFLISCYFMCTQLFKNKNKMITHILLYASALAIVAIITNIKHASYGFDEKTADWIVSPFYNDHTAYGCVLAMFIPVVAVMFFLKNTHFIIKLFSLFLFLVFIVSIITSYARAGWLSLAVSLFVLITLIFRIKFRTLLFTLFGGILFFMVFQSEVLMFLNKNNTDSDGDLMQNIESMTNISTDVSNVERLNRWNCALQMFQEKPFLGFGPGTYQFLYAPYQKSSLKTVISTNFGNRGNAHSEYLGPLSEQGLIGGLLVFALVLAVMFLGYRLVYTIQEKSLKVLTIAILMGMTTYFVHGFLNNFLETDKASVPFWGFMAMLVCIDIYHKNVVEEK
ncbi:MAG: O-antigen ligase family protein [Bacteroidota bacterium]